MKIIKLFSLFILTLLSFNSYSYGGGGGGSKSCAKPKFTEFKPAHLAETTAQSEFSFLASKSTNPSTIEVTVKKLPVEVSINKINKGYVVTGNLPESLIDTFARVSVGGKAKNCFGSDGWVVKIVN